MLKIIYNSKPTYYDFNDVNDTTEKELSIVFDDDSSSTDILNEIIRLLKYVGYSYIDRKSILLNAIETLSYDGVVIDDTKENQDFK